MSYPSNSVLATRKLKKHHCASNCAASAWASTLFLNAVNPQVAIPLRVSDLDTAVCAVLAVGGYKCWPGAP